MTFIMKITQKGVLIKNHKSKVSNALQYTAKVLTKIIIYKFHTYFYDF